MSLKYPEKKWIKERKDHTEKPELNERKQISLATLNNTERTPDIPRSVGKIHKID
jgi:hypothetical protein